MGTPNSVARPPKGLRRLEQGWNVWTCDSQAPGAGRSSTSFWHETGRNGEVVLIGYGETRRGRAQHRQEAAFAEAARIKDSQAEMHAWRKSREIFS